MYDLKELRKISRQVRVLASRTAHSSHDQATANIQRLVNYVMATPLLHREIDRAPKPAGDGIEILLECTNAGERLDLPLDPLDELGFIHSVLTALAGDTEDFWNRAYGYAGLRGMEEPARELLNELIPAYVGYFESYLANMIIDLSEADDRRRSVDVTVHAPSQINIANDQGQISATQHVGADATAVLAIARELIAAIQSAPHLEGIDDAEEAYALASQTVAELQQTQPNPSRLVRIQQRLAKVSASAELPVQFSALVIQLVETITKLTGG